jgi:hypothetical protein
LAVHSGRYHRQAVWPCRRVGCPGRDHTLLMKFEQPDRL